jgi:hypothetical protein
LPKIVKTYFSLHSLHHVGRHQAEGDPNLGRVAMLSDGTSYP